VGAVCPGGPRIWPKPGYFVTDEAVDQRPVRCVPASKCLGGQGSPCAPRYTGDQCGLCLPGSRKIGFSCVGCSPRGSFVYSILGIAVFLTILMSLFLVLPDDVLNPFFAGIVALQIVSAAGSTVSVELDDHIKGIYSYLSFINLDFETLQPGCFFGSSGYDAKFFGNLLFTLVNLAWVMLPLLAVAVIMQIKHKGKYLWFYKARAWSCLTIMTTLNYYVLTLRAFEVLACTPTGRLVVQPSTQCWVGKHVPIAIFALLIIAGITVGTPIFFFFVLWRGHKRGYTVPERKRTFMARWGSLFDSFRPSNVFFGAVPFAVDLLVALTNAFGKSDPVAQSVVTFVVLLALLSVTAARRPFARQVENFGTVAAYLVSALGALVNAIVSTSVAKSLSKVQASGATPPRGYSTTLTTLAYIIVALTGVVLLAYAALFAIEIGSVLLQRGRFKNQKAAHLKGRDTENVDDVTAKPATATEAEAKYAELTDVVLTTTDEPKAE
jgi:hypothetical protein